MPRDIHNNVSKGVEGDFSWVIMLEIQLDSGTVYVHTGVGSLDWDGATWQGVGSLARLSGLTESADGGDDRMTVGLSGLPIETMPDFVTEFTEEDTTGRDWFMYFAMLDDDGDIENEDDVVELSAGLTGAVDLGDGDNRVVTLSLTTEAAQGRAKLFYRFTNEDQQKFFSGDLAFEFMNDLTDELRWGSADPKPIDRGPFVANHTRSFDR